MATPKKKHLIELMIEAGVKWPDGAEYAAQDKRFNKVNFYKDGKPNYPIGLDSWMADNCNYMRNDGLVLSSICRNWHQTIVTREQYAEALALAANVSEPAEQIDTQQEPQYCTSVMRQMPSETIESLLTEIKAKREEHGELVAKVDALVLEITSIEQQVNNKLKEYEFSLYPVASSSETEQSVITDWRDLRAGDVIECIPYRDERDNTSRWPGGWSTSIVGTIQVVESIDPDSGKISLLNTKDSGYAFRFIYRP